MLCLDQKAHAYESYGYQNVSMGGKDPIPLSSRSLPIKHIRESQMLGMIVMELSEWLGGYTITDERYGVYSNIWNNSNQ